MAEEGGIEISKSPKFNWGLLLVSAITFIWLAFTIFIVFKGTPPTLELPPNALGDFLAGMFAPLAFLWLAMGFHQQGKELKLQREELELQREELKQSRKALRGQERELIEQTKQLTEQARLTQQDIKLKLNESTPRLSFHHFRILEEPHETKRLHIRFFNNGGIAVGIKIKIPATAIKAILLGMSQEIASRQINALRISQEAEINIHVPKGIPLNFGIELRYMDVFGTEYKHLIAFPCTEEEWGKFFAETQEVIYKKEE